MSSMRMRTQGGAVHILFLIFVLIIGIAFGALWFTEIQRNDQVDQRNRTLVSENNLLRSKYQFAKESYELIAPLLSEKFPETLPEPNEDEIQDRTAADVLKNPIDDLKREWATLGDLIDKPGTTPTSTRAAWDPILARYTAVKNDNQAKDLTISQLKTESTEKDNQIATVNQSKADDRRKADEDSSAQIDNLTNQRTELQGQNDTLADKNRELTEEQRKIADKANQDVQKAVAETNSLKSQVRGIQTRLRIQRQTEKPDGNVLRADPVRGIAWIDIGAKSMLRAGTRFKVYETGKGGVKIHKGYMRATRIDKNMAECRIDEVVAGREIEAGDWIYNPYFSPGKSHRFVFLGQLPGSWNRATVESMLKARGATIDSKVTVNTDFLVMGETENLGGGGGDDEEAEEDEEGEGGASLTESPDYRRAIEFGVEIIRARDLTPYLKF